VVESAAQQIVERLRQCDPAEYEQTVPEAVGSLIAIAADETATRVLRVEAQIAAAELIVRHTEPLDMLAQFDVALDLLRDAFRHRSSLTFTGRRDASLVASIFGTALIKRLKYSNTEEIHEIHVEAESVLRAAVDEADPGTPDMPGRLANLASHLLAPDGRFSVVSRTAGTLLRSRAQESMTLLHQAIAIGESSTVEPSMLTQLHAHLGHATRSYWHRVRTQSDPRDDLLADITDSYRRADALAAAHPGCTSVAMSDWALHDFDRFETTGDIGALNRAIEAAAAGLPQRSIDDDHRSEAQMQLAEFHLARYRATGDDDDLSASLTHSHDALNSWYIARNGFEHHGLKWRRLAVLQVAASAPGAHRDEDNELRCLLDEVTATESINATPEIACIRLLHDLDQAIATIPFDQVEAEVLLDGLRSIVRAASFQMRPLSWVCRLVMAEHRLYEHLTFNDAAADTKRLRATANLAISMVSELSADPADYASTTASIVECLIEIGVADADHDVVQRAADISIASLDHLRPASGVVPPSTIVHLGVLAMRANSYVGNSQRIEVLREFIVAQARRMPDATSPWDALRPSVRVRRSIAGELAGAAAGATEHVLTMAELSFGLGTDDDVRSAFLSQMEIESHAATKVFISAGYLSAIATVICDGTWDRVELPLLRMDQFGPLVANAYRSHDDSAAGERSALQRWRDSYAALTQGLNEALDPLNRFLDIHPEVDVHASGWAHTLPIIPALSRMSIVGTSVAGVLFRPIVHDDVTQRGRRLGWGVVAVPGRPDGLGYLAKVMDDVEFATRVLGDSLHTVLVDPNATSLDD
jgi:hypothetical protein